MIIRHGYAEHHRTGSTRQYRKDRAAALSSLDVCAICGNGPMPGDPWEAHHTQAFADFGHMSLLAKAHRSCNRALGRM